MNQEDLLKKAARHHQAGDLGPAEKLYRRVLETNPDHPGALGGLGLVAHQTGHLDAAEELLRRAVKMRPDQVHLQTGLGVLYCDLTRFDDAVGHFREAVRLDAASPEANSNLGTALKETAAYDEAERYLTEALRLRPDYAEAHCNLGLVMAEQGRYSEAVTRLRKALELRPDYPKAHTNLQNIFETQVPFWHFPMLNDSRRNDAFDRALRAAVEPDTVVLDIGSGSGLLAMMAVRAGARHVYSIEMVPLIADKAREIVAANGMAGRITVIGKKSTELEVGRDLPEPADLLVTETFDVGLLGEGVVNTVGHARARLLNPGAPVLPATATVYAALFECEALRAMGRVNVASDFDVSAFNEFQPAKFQHRVRALPWNRLCAPVTVFEFDFNGAGVRPEQRVLDVEVDRDGVCHGVVFWYRLDLGGGAEIDTGPDLDASHWKQMVQLYEPAFPVAAGDTVRLMAQHDCVNISITP